MLTSKFEVILLKNYSIGKYFVWEWGIKYHFYAETDQRNDYNFQYYVYMYAIYL